MWKKELNEWKEERYLEWNKEKNGGEVTKHQIKKKKKKKKKKKNHKVERLKLSKGKKRDVSLKERKTKFG